MTKLSSKVHGLYVIVILQGQRSHRKPHCGILIGETRKHCCDQFASENTGGDQGIFNVASEAGIVCKLAKKQLSHYNMYKV